jgi:hypothetical protein
MKCKKYHIEYLGKVLHTDHWAELSVDKCQEIRDLYYTKPDFAQVEKNLKSIHAGGTRVSEVTNYYVKDLMAMVKLYSPKWSIAEALECDDLIRYFYSRTLASEKVYPQSNSLINNFQTALRLSGGGVAMKPSNFPMKTVDDILETYNINNCYYDFSCGWGVRLLSSMKHRINYFGTDPNHILVDRLNQLHIDYDVTNSATSRVDIRCQGSEVFVPEWENCIGVAFSSPPYFTLEDYRIGNQSINNKSYDVWLTEYMLETLQNIKKYLVDGGHLLVNIKNFANYKLYDDTFNLAESIGFKYIETRTLDNITRPSAKTDLNTDESIMVFKKDGIPVRINDNTLNSFLM